MGTEIQKEIARFHKPLPAGLNVAITLRYLATGDSNKKLMYGFRVAFNTILLLLPEVCEVIYQIYQDEQLKCPSIPQEWCEKAVHFGQRWNFYHAVGNLDGKYVAIKCPKWSGSKYYHYKGFYSVVLLALVDADDRFLWADVGSNGCCSHAQIFNKCELKLSILDGTTGFPDTDPMRGDDRDMPNFIVADDAFALRIWLLKPFSGRKT